MEKPQLINDVEFDIDSIVSYLQGHRAKLEDLYTWKTDHAAFKELQLGSATAYLATGGKPVSLLTNLHLRALVTNAMKDADQSRYKDLAEWIVKKWGGIYAGELAIPFGKIEEVSRKPLYARIASVSKILAFWKPDAFAIYDSRVAYTLNWILLSQKAGSKFFPVPEGRNSRMKAFDVEVLVRLQNAAKYVGGGKKNGANDRWVSKVDEDIFIAEDEAYTTYNELMLTLAPLVWKGDADQAHWLQKTEMLLFALADSVVFDEIVRSVGLEFKSTRTH